MLGRRPAAWALCLCLCLASCGGLVNEGSPDSLYEAALRLEVLGLPDEAHAAMAAAARLDPTRESLAASLQRLSSLGQCRRNSPFCPPDAPGSDVSPHSRAPSHTPGKGAMHVQSVSWGVCGALLAADEAGPVGVAFTRDDPHSLRAVVNVPEDVDEVVELGCEKGGDRARKTWHTLRVAVPGVEEGALLSWIEGDDPFVVARLFLKYNDITEEGLLRPLYALMVQRHAALKNETLDAPSPPWDVPEEHLDAFTMGGRVEVRKHFIDESSSASRNNYEFGHYRRSREEIEGLVGLARRRASNYYGDTDQYLYQALTAMPGGLKDKRVVIMGSLEPWYEAVCIAFEAESCTTIEYNKLEFDHPKIRTFTVEEYAAASPKPRFDVALSISSFEHDGLGRYGDAIDPDGDLRAMANMRTVLEEGGVLLLAVPVGKDLLKWNAHRKYGRLRLPLLFRNWTLVGQAGLTVQILDDERPDTHNQPVWILQNSPPSDAASGGAMDWMTVASI